MKIPDALQSTPSIASATKRPIEPEDRQLGRPDQGLPKLTPTQVDRIDVHRRDGDDDQGGLTQEDRISRWAERFEKRLDKLLERDGLTEEQKGELLAAKDDFHALVDRLKNALDTINPGVASRAFRTMVQDLSESVRAALAEEQGNDVIVDGGSGITPGLVPPGDDGDDPPRLTPASVERIGGGDEGDQNPLDRLQAMQERFDARFEAYLSREGLDPEQAEAMQAAKDQFDKVLERLSNAYTKGEKDTSFLRFGFNTALQGLRDQLDAIFAGDRDHYGKPDLGLHASEVEIYNEGGVSDGLGRLSPSSVDHVV